MELKRQRNPLPCIAGLERMPRRSTCSVYDLVFRTSRKSPKSDPRSHLTPRALTLETGPARRGGTRETESSACSGLILIGLPLCLGVHWQGVAERRLAGAFMRSSCAGA